MALKEREKSLEEYKAKFDKLKEDFKYNLKLLKERDAELSKYDSQSVGESIRILGLLFIIMMYKKKNVFQHLIRCMLLK